MLKSLTLKNGIHVATYNLPQLKSVHVQVSVKGGSIVETKENNGIAHFIEHMLVQGIPSYPDAEALSSYVESLAGTYSAYTQLLKTGFSITLPASCLEDALHITSEIFFEPLFEEDAIEKEREAVLDEVTQDLDSHFYKINDFFLKMRFAASSALVLHTAGSPKAIKKLTREELIAFWSKYFVPKNTYVLITGNFNEQALENLLIKYFDQYRGETELDCFEEISSKDLDKGRVAIRYDKDLHTVYMDLTIPAMNLGNPIEDRIKQNLATLLLGRLRNSRLFRLLRYQKGLLYSVTAGQSVLPGVGYIHISSEIPPGHVEEVTGLIIDEIKKFIEDGPGLAELEFAKNFLTNQWLMAFDHPSSIADWIEGDLLWEESVKLPEDYSALIKNTKPKDLTRIIKKYWNCSNINLTLQGAIQNSEENVKKYTTILKTL